MSEVATMKIDTSGLNTALERMIPQSKQELGDLLRNEVVRPLIRKIISITPPAQGAANGSAKKAGEIAIMDDIKRIMRPGSDDFIDLCRKIWGGDVHTEQFGHAGASPIGDVYERILSGGQIHSFHQERRNKATGRVGFQKKGVSAWNNNAARGQSDLNKNRALRLTTGVKRSDLRNLDVGLVRRSEFDAYVKQQQQRVGILGGGWNAAAEQFGVSRPAWISRHGTGRGSVPVMELDGERMKIVISNDVGYTGEVKGLQARVQKALDWQARDMNRRVDDFAKKTRRI